MDELTVSTEQLSLRRIYFLYHELRAASCNYSYVLETAEFEKHIDLFSRMRETGYLGPRPGVTFDDGHISNFELALPILHSRGIQAHFFITVGWTGHKTDYMGWQQLRTLHQSGQLIGAHGWTHTLLTHCTEKQLQMELGGARVTLEDKLGTSITTMSLPGGRYNRRIIAACQEAGYTEVYSSIPREETEPLGSMIGRLNIRNDMGLDYIAKVLHPNSQLLSSLGRQYQVKLTAKALLGDRLYEQLWALLNRREPDADGDRVSAE